MLNILSTEQLSENGVSLFFHVGHILDSITYIYIFVIHNFNSKILS